MDEIVRAFTATLTAVNKALTDSFTGPGRLARWGVAGFREEALVFLLAETMQSLGWSCAYESVYEGTSKRGDILAEKGGERSLWIEAKWWWFHVGLADILALDAAKLRTVSAPQRPIAAVFTVDGDGIAEGEHRWTSDGAEPWLRAQTPPGWTFLGASVAASPYRGTSSGSRRAPPTAQPGIFAAAFFELALS